MPLVRFWSVLVLTLGVAVSFLDRAQAESIEVRTTQEKVLLEAQGFAPWRWLQSDCSTCSLYIMRNHEELYSDRVSAFVQALMDSKPELLKLYGVHGAEYNLLAHMAIGILGRESNFYQSTRYKIKESFPWAISLVKAMRYYLYISDRRPDNNSRGPTQIKMVPRKIAEVYGVTPETLYIPENAARATMGFLIEALGELKRRAVNNNLEFIVPETYADYLPYIYFGKTRALLKRTATPDQNIYIQEMRKYMSWVELYEGPDFGEALRPAG